MQATKKQTKELVQIVDAMYDSISYNGDDDSVGNFTCCGNRSFESHEPNCNYYRLKQLVKEIKADTSDS